MIDVTTCDSLLTLAEASKLFPHRPSRCTLWRWMNEGVRGVRLESVVVGGRRLTSKPAIADFVAKTTAAVDRRPISQTRTARQRDIATQDAMRELAADGC
ncbi:MAG TPA: DUF1580 domain-containing protein [Pirellulaceae bacterium]|nr:DUF1580 domain-containing protein [Pirellulaceae bacterium]